MSEQKIEQDLKFQAFDYQEYIEKYATSFVNGFISNIFSDGIISEVDVETLKKYFASPDNYQKELESITQYYYISNGEVFQLFDMAKVLPTLNYKIDAFDKNKQYDKNANIINKMLHKVKHKTLTRDVISQTITSGTLCGIWLGGKNNPYFYVFDNLQYVFPSHRINGEWVVTVDLEWLSKMSDNEREVFFSNLSPYITESMYKKYKSNTTNEKYKYIHLPQDRTSVILTHTLKRNQNRGIGWAVQGMYDILHKKKLRDLEKTVANKIINAVAVLTVGSDKNPEYANIKLPSPLKKKIHSGVKAALEKNSTNGVSVITIPEFAQLVFPDIKADGSLDPKKFESINKDILTSFGISPAMTSGDGGNFASAKINLDVFYKRLSVLLEEIENEIYGKLFNLVLPSNQSDNFYMTYDKEPPLTNKEKVDILLKLHSQEGFSLKAVIDSLNGVDFDSYINQSIHEQEVLKLPEKIQPYKSAYTSGNNDDNGRPSNENPETEGAEKSKNNDSNSLPE